MPVRTSKVLALDVISEATARRGRKARGPESPPAPGTPPSATAAGVRTFFGGAAHPTSPDVKRKRPQLDSPGPSPSTPRKKRAVAPISVAGEAEGEDGSDGAAAGDPRVFDRVCFVNPATGQMLTGNRAPRRLETIRRYLAEGWVPLDGMGKRRMLPGMVDAAPPSPHAAAAVAAPRADVRGIAPQVGCRRRVDASKAHDVSWTGLALQMSGVRSFYGGFRVNGVRYALSDCVLVRAAAPGAPPFLGRLLRCWEETTSHRRLAQIQWYLRPSELGLPAGAGNGREVLSSEQSDAVPLDALDGLCNIVPLAADASPPPPSGFYYRRQVAAVDGAVTDVDLSPFAQAHPRADASLHSMRAGSYDEGVDGDDTVSLSSSDADDSMMHLDSPVDSCGGWDAAELPADITHAAGPLDLDGWC